MHSTLIFDIFRIGVVTGYREAMLNLAYTQYIQPQTFAAFDFESVSYPALLCPAISCPAFSCPAISRPAFSAPPLLCVCPILP